MLLVSYGYHVATISVLYFILGRIDYDAGPHNVTVPAGVTEVTFNVTIHNDTILERTESFTLSVNSRFFETDRILIGNTNSALVIINDTSGK